MLEVVDMVLSESWSVMLASAARLDKPVLSWLMPVIADPSEAQKTEECIDAGALGKSREAVACIIECFALVLSKSAVELEVLTLKLPR